jgi:hypothetical protein
MLNGATKYGSETLSVPTVKKDGERISIEFTINLLRLVLLVGHEGFDPSTS